MPNTIIEEFQKRSQPLLDSFKKEMASLRTNRPNAGLIGDMRIQYYDQTLTIKEVGSIKVVPPREIVVQVWDRQAVGGIVKSIETSDLGLSVNTEENIIRISLPKLTEERRKEFIKKVKKITEQYRIQLRHLRDEMNKRIQEDFQNHEIAEDQKFKFKEEIQNETDKINKEIESLLENKIKEISE